MKTVTLYTKPDCGLCKRADAAIREVFRDVPFAWSAVDITRDAEAFRTYCLDIPVVCVDGVERFRHAVDPERLRALLA